MRARLVAAAAGIAVIAAAALAFSLGSHPVVAGTNTAEPLYETVAVPASERRCQRIARVPGGADRIQIWVTRFAGAPPMLLATLRDPSGRIAAGEARFGLGESRIELESRTRAGHRATFCLSNPGRDWVALAGETKRLPPAPGRSRKERRGVASVIFLEPGSETWASRTGEIVDRFGYGLVGAIGTWALWVAALLAAVAAGLALWLVTRPDPRT
jgi:hypothetical protein